VSASTTLSPSDQALIAALAAWGGAEEPAFLLRLGQPRASRLVEARRTLRPVDPVAGLLDAHASQMAPDPARVHHTWYVRALRDESPSVRRIVVAAAEEPLRSILIRELSVAPGELNPDHPPDPEVGQVALSLWTERLVGDVATRDDDPPAVIALVSSSPREVYRLCRVSGLAKLSTLLDVDSSRFGAKNQSRIQSFHERIHALIHPKINHLGHHDWVASQPFGRHALAGLGLITLGRLLGQVEGHRLRWALQHVPYPLAKRLRRVANGRPASVRAVIEWEARLLNESLAILRDEGRWHADFGSERSPTP